VIVVPDQDAVDAESARQERKLTDEEVTDLLTEQVRQLSRQLADYKRPRKVHVRMGEFEKTSTGKVKRYLYELEGTEIAN
jgi:acyl-CoA synthetase (AMP-forming)/AMP-acid ligase II